MSSITVTVAQTTTQADGSSIATNATIDIPLVGGEAAKAAAAPVLKVFYWPKMMIRNAPIIRMLEHTGTKYEVVSDFDQMSAVGSFKKGEGDVFAPPFVVDGDFVISQSTACAMYVADKVGLTPKGANQFKCFQYISDVVDTFEANLGKHNEDGPTLKKFMEGDRFKALLGNIERAIQGPYYFGGELSACDFFLAAHLDWRESAVFGPLKAKYGVDVLAGFPKISALHAALTATDGYKNYAGDLKVPGPMKDEVLNAYNDGAEVEP